MILGLGTASGLKRLPFRNAVIGFCYRRCVPLPGLSGPWTGCRWVIGKVVRAGASRYCGKACVPGRAWCAEHHAVVYLDSVVSAGKFTASALRAAR